MDFCEEVRDVSIQHRLERSQTRALAKLRPPERNGPTLPVFGNHVGTGLETHLFRHLLSLSIIVFSVSKRTRRWETVGMNSLGIPQDGITKRLGVSRQTISYHLPKMPELANPVNSDLSRGFTVAQVAERMYRTCVVWSPALVARLFSMRIEKSPDHFSWS
ncbi:MAG: hypothetical protein H8D55_01990 [Deltaproteobacteria bacterium]|nr:hypothetical protein [Deltaproteobacteria bacterium]